MSITFVRVDDRMIHGQTCTRWALEYPCDGIVAVNDAAAKGTTRALLAKRLSFGLWLTGRKNVRRLLKAIPDIF